MHGGKDNPKGYPYKDKGELKRDPLIRDLWVQGTNSIHDMNVMNTDATSYHSKTPKKCLETTEEEKNKKYPEACIKNCWNLAPFVLIRVPFWIVLTSMHGATCVDYVFAKHVSGG